MGVIRKQQNIETSGNKEVMSYVLPSVVDWHTHQHEKCTFFFTCQSQVNHLPLQIYFLHGGNHYAKQNTYLNCHYAHINSTESPLFIFQTIEYNSYTVTCHTTVPSSYENDSLFIYVGFYDFSETLRTRKRKINP